MLRFSPIPQSREYVARCQAKHGPVFSKCLEGLAPPSGVDVSDSDQITLGKLLVLDPSGWCWRYDLADQSRQRWGACIIPTDYRCGRILVMGRKAFVAEQGATSGL